MLIKECMKCPRPAVIHVTEIAAQGPPAKIIELHLCLDHAFAAGFMGIPVVTQKAAGDNPEGQILSGDSDLEIIQQMASDLVAGTTDEADAVVSVCPICGQSWGQFKQHGLLGCPNDYAQFQPQLGDLITSMHERHAQHIGKIPPQSKAADTVVRAKRIQLEIQLNAAIQGERYEEAARLRDQLRTHFGPESKLA